MNQKPSISLASQIADLQNMTGEQLEQTLRTSGFSIHADAVQRLLDEIKRLRRMLRAQARAAGAGFL